MTTTEASRPSCVACKMQIESGATLCPRCGTHQEKWRRVSGRTVVFLSASAALFSLITAAVALYPQAVSVLFPRPNAELMLLSFDAVSHRREQARIELFNTGNQDIYVNSVVLSVDPTQLPAESQVLGKSPPYNYVISEWLRMGEARTFLVPLKQGTTDWVVRSIDDFDTASSAFADKGAGAVWRCFSVLPMTMRSGRPAVPEAFDQVGGLVDLVGHIRFTTPSSDVVGTLEIDLPFKGALFERQHRQCEELLDRPVAD